MKNIIPSVDKLLTLLEQLNASNRPISLAEICSMSESSPSTGYRMLQTLLAHGWLQKEAGNTYSFHFSGMTEETRTLRNRLLAGNAQTLLNSLAQRTGMTCKISIRHRHEQLSLLYAEGPGAHAIAARPGSTYPIVEGSVGAVLLADVSKNEITNLLAAAPEDLREKQEPKQLWNRIALLKKQGMVFCGENRWHIDALSVPIRDSKRHVVAALTLLGIRQDGKESPVMTALPQLKKTAQALQKELFANHLISQRSKQP